MTINAYSFPDSTEITGPLHLEGELHLDRPLVIFIKGHEVFRIDEDGNIHITGTINEVAPWAVPTPPAA